jgi:hypothetical protein
MARQRLDSVTYGFVNRISSRNAAGDIGEADAVNAIGVFVDEGDVAHCFLSLTEQACLPENGSDGSDRKVFARMRDRYLTGLGRMLEMMVRTSHADVDPAILL